jgi:hypothetical protein
VDVITFKANRADIERWKEAAWESRMTLSAWIRSQCLDGVAYPVAAKDPPPPEPVKHPVNVCTNATVEVGSWCRVCGRYH